MAVRTVKRRGERRLVIDIRFTNPDGTPGRYRRDAEVQLLAAARAEERRRIAALVSGDILEAEAGTRAEPRARAGERAAQPEATPTKDVLFGAVAEAYLTTYARSHLKPSTLHGYRKTINGFLVPRLGQRSIDTIDATVVRELDAEYVEREAKPATRRQMQIALRSILCRYAVEAKLLKVAPVFPPLPRAGRKIMNALTHDEVERLLAASCEAHRLAFLLAAFAGLRAGEVRGLRWRDVDVGAAQLVVRENVCRGVVAAPKSGHERVVPLTGALLVSLERTKLEGRFGLVSKTAKGTPWGEYGLAQAFVRACRRAGLAKTWRLHDLRHFFVTALFRAGVSAPTVQALAGHAHLTTTQRYAHVASVDLRSAISKLEGAPGVARG